jgi:cytochrome P450
MQRFCKEETNLISQRNLAGRVDREHDMNTDAPLPKGIQLTSYDPTYQADPYAVLKTLRERAPVLEDDQLNRWYLTSFEDVRAVLRDKDMSSDPYKARRDSYMARVAAGQSLPREQTFIASMLFRDDPDHRRLRSLVSGAFTPKIVELMRPRIRAIAHELLDAAATPEFDLMASFAEPLPVIVIAEMLGIDTRDRQDFKRWSELAVWTFVNPFRTEAEATAGKHAQQALNEYFQRMIDERRVAPRDDLIMSMLQAFEGNDRLSDAEIVMQCNLLLVAGNLTTTDLIGNGVKALLQHPEQMAKLRAQPPLMMNAVEEMLRFDTPVTNLSRNAQREFSLGGCPIHVGDSLVVSLAAANRDPAANTEPERFDIERADIQHQSFGGGKHLCLGASLARAEAQEALRVLLERYPQLRPSPRGFKYRVTASFRGLTQYWVHA